MISHISENVYSSVNASCYMILLYSICNRPRLYFSDESHSDELIKYMS